MSIIFSPTENKILMYKNVAFSKLLSTRSSEPQHQPQYQQVFLELHDSLYVKQKSTMLYTNPTHKRKLQC